MRARPNRAMTAAATIVAHMRKKVRTATEGDGAEYPLQLPMMAMPNGRGRDRPALIHWVASTRTKKLPRKTIRCRRRRKIMASTTTDNPITVAPQPVPITLIALAASVSQGVRTSASRRRNHVLARSPSRSHDGCSETRNAAATLTTARMNHAVVLTAIGCGSGGGAPVGRRWRCSRWAGESLGRPTAIGGLGGPAWAVVRSAFSLTAHPAFLGLPYLSTVSRRTRGVLNLVPARTRRGGVSPASLERPRGL